METTDQKNSAIKNLFAGAVILLAIGVSLALYFFVMGDSSNFTGGDSVKGHPSNYLGIVYKGGLIVPVLMSFFLMVLTFSVERFITINKAYGKGSIEKFLRDVKKSLSKNDVQSAIDRSLDQKGSVGNVVYTVLNRYNEIWNEKDMSKDQKVAAVQQELEESTSLELPMLEKNLTIIATLASVATLVGLLGTVIGMIKAFASMGTASATDASALANGISEALINTALGIATSAIAIMSYNSFTSKIDTLTYSIDEMGFSISQSFKANYKAEKEKPSYKAELV
ncbi:MAG: MotA/TolQ/ExbB proton channel family protein [Cytophagaceae bacterium]